MKNAIKIERDKYKISIGKPQDGYISLITYFKPLDATIFLLELESTESVDYLSNVAYYGEDLGGISIKLNQGKTLEDMVTDIMIALDRQIKVQ